MTIRGNDERTFADRLRMAGDPQREVIWERKTTADSKALWNVPCPERWELLPKSERDFRSKCCAALCFLGEILLWDRSVSQGTVATAKVCGQCHKPLYGIQIIRNSPEFTAELHRYILSHFDDALSMGIAVHDDGSWRINAGPHHTIKGLARETLRAIEKAGNANMPEQPEFA